MTEAEHYRAADTPKQGLHDSVGAFATMDDSLQESLAPLRGSPPSPATRVFGALGHGFIGGLLVLAVLAPMAYSLPWYGTNASTTLSGWWGVNAKVKGSGHSEMVVPTYFFLGTVLPIVVAGLLHAFLHKRAPVGRLSLLSQFLHRKPKLFNSLISNGEIGFVIVVTALNVVVFYYQFMKRYKPTNATADTIKNVGTALGFTGLFDMVRPHL
ncbi:hypothetical protein DYB32_010584 [Aphanomyces invadans]|uniref:Uncharacterized protein n=1 Tax=Aphanomyces invadans TaxID=157072 RepID=A0A418AFJ1_9STRA|nr:hypothetical protein DYB32_010584 [Aphanomyces invadans]